MAESLDIRTVALLCPACKEKLRAPRGDVLLFCGECATASEVKGGRLVERGMVALGPDEREPCEGGEPLRLPFWCYKVDVEFSGKDSRVVDNLMRVARPDHVFVPAFRQRNVVAFGDMGMLLTLRPPELTSLGPRPFTGGTLGSVEASRLVEPMVLYRADQIRDVTDVEVQVRIGGVAVVTVPAVDSGDRIKDLVVERDWPAAAFLDLDALRGRSPAGTTCGRR